ncbi:hypothetical protein BJY17_003240 [Agromyces hippuratus]|uniref:Uncharacterized protein n=1 Tax=Agromyces hippuratus TaxID=286438 RepID=A0A852X2X8_9MICO|nr:hypothetical protein [Agromyces hippuratus]
MLLLQTGPFAARTRARDAVFLELAGAVRALATTA